MRMLYSFSFQAYKMDNNFDLKNTKNDSIKKRNNASKYNETSIIWGKKSWSYRDMQKHGVLGLLRKMALMWNKYYFNLNKEEV